MNASEKTWDLAQVLRETAWGRDAVARAEACTSDARAAQRREAQQCRACFYLRGRQGGTVVTRSPCGLCGAVMTFRNTCYDQLCKACAQSHRLCVFCGGDAELKLRRKL